MFIGFIGGSQHVLPKRNFARFVLMMFLMYSLIIRTVYLGSFYEIIKSKKRIPEVKSIEELIQRDFMFLSMLGNSDIFQGTDQISRR
jgi:hypothetical protein